MTTKLYPRVVRGAVYGLLVVLAIGGGLRFVRADVVPSTAIHFGSIEVQYGKTIELGDHAKLGIFPTALPNEADVTWQTTSDTLPALPADRKLLGSVYRLHLDGVTKLNAIKRPMAVALPFGSSLWNRQVWQYDLTTKSWTALTTGLNATKDSGQASPTTLDGYLMILENRTMEQGIGSWYCNLSCSARYPKYHGTSNDFPVGSLVKVTNVANGQVVVIKIVSKWGQPAGRVVDLSWSAFTAIGGTKIVGLLQVVVQPAPGAALGPVKSAITSSTPSTVNAESIPKLSIHGDSINPPDVQGAGYAIYDQTTGTFLAGKNADTTGSIASITKLMTVMVFLDTKPNLAKTVTYSSVDNATCSCLALKPGETLSLKDLLWATVVGSANNGAKALARSTGLTKAQFVAAMNAKAKAIGLTHTSYTEPSGLDAGNMSTPREIALLGAYAFHTYPLIRQITTTQKYSFTTLNTKKPHTIILRYSLVGSSTLGKLVATGSKTGYTDEAGNTYVFRAKNAQGAQVVITIFGEPSWQQRNKDLAALFNWAFGHHAWN